jgi:hypothetical protein
MLSTSFHIIHRKVGTTVLLAADDGNSASPRSRIWWVTAFLSPFRFPPIVVATSYSSASPLFAHAGTRALREHTEHCKSMYVNPAAPISDFNWCLTPPFTGVRQMLLFTDPDYVSVLVALVEEYS